MKITRVEATALDIPVTFEELGSDHTQTTSMCYAEIETDDGTVGHGISSITQCGVVADIINNVCRPAIIGADALAHEKIWNTLYWTCTPWGQTGYASHAISAIDLALWDIKGKALGQPVWRLLGGARDTVEAYTTCGFSFLDREHLAEAMRRMVERGFKSVKMQVGRPGLDDRRPHPTLGEMIREDAARVRVVRDAVGDGVEIAIDAGCRLDLYHAVELARLCEPLGVAFFEEPIMQNDVRLLAQMRRRTSIPLTAGQNEGLAYRFRDMLLHEAVDIVQPNVIITGGITQCVKIAGMAAAFNVQISNGGGCPYHNMHLQAGVSNGTVIEYQFNAVRACKAFFDDLPEPVDGWLQLPEEPGLGLHPNADAIRELKAG